jgi:DNA-binding GntR family transcriptional regulator
LTQEALALEAKPYEQIAEHLRRQIDSGELRPGDRLPSIREIASTWQVAKATADRAVAALRTEGLVRALPGSGGTLVTRGEQDRRDVTVTVGLGTPDPVTVTSVKVVPASEELASELEVDPGCSVVILRLQV